MSEFHVGQKVAFVGSDFKPSTPNRHNEVTPKIEKGAVCIIRWIGQAPFDDGRNGVMHTLAVRIAERVRTFSGPSAVWVDHPYPAECFRPLVEQSQAISLFRKIAADATKARKVTVRA